MFLALVGIACNLAESAARETYKMSRTLLSRAGFAQIVRGRMAFGGRLVHGQTHNVLWKCSTTGILQWHHRLISRR